MNVYDDPKSAEFDALEDMREEEVRREFGCCPGPVDLWTTTINRRGFLKVGVGGLFSMMMAQWLDPRSAYAMPAAKAKNCILLWMNGGPSHIDTWDPKPGASTAGKFSSIKTSVPGLEICQHLPAIAEQAQHLSVIRGMTSREGNHQRAQYLMHTGYAPSGSVQHPSLGSWVSEELGNPQSDLPNFVSISGPSIGAAFLGVQHGPFVIQNPAQPPANIAYPRNVNDGRFSHRTSALDAMEAEFAAETGDAKIKGRQAVYAKAVKLMHSPKLKAFDLSEESESVKSSYGDSNSARGCLMARRLVESGVKFVEVVLDGWDTHQNNFDRTSKLMGQYDPAMASLIKDLEARKLLDSTLVIWMGEFGRTPRINGNDGRDHYPQAWSAVLAGGGARGGYVHGQTDAEGAKVVDKQVIVPDFFATVATLLGMDPAKSMMTPVGRPIAITEKGSPVKELIA